MILRKVSSFEPNIFIKVILYQDLCHLFLSMALNASSLRMGSFINCSILIFPLLVCGSSAQILVTLGIVLFSFNSFTPRMFGCGDLYLWHLLSSAVHLVLHLQHIVKLFLCQLPLSRMIEPMTKVKKNQLNNNWFVKWNLIKLRKGLNLGIVSCILRAILLLWIACFGSLSFVGVFKLHSYYGRDQTLS